MHPLGMAAGHPEEACHRICGDCAQAGRGTYPTPFAQMISKGLSLGLRDLSIEQRRATSLRGLFATEAAPEEADAVLAVDFA
jgi:hypothetical protein